MSKVPDPELTLRILKTNRTEYLIVVDDGQDLEGLYAEWCRLDDAFCEGELAEKEWMEVDKFLRSKGVQVIAPSEVQVLAEFY
jgi:hypothetical protein